MTGFSGCLVGVCVSSVIIPVQPSRHTFFLLFCILLKHHDVRPSPNATAANAAAAPDWLPWLYRRVQHVLWIHAVPGGGYRVPGALRSFDDCAYRAVRMEEDLVDDGVYRGVYEYVSLSPIRSLRYTNEYSGGYRLGRPYMVKPMPLQLRRIPNANINPDHRLDSIRPENAMRQD